LAEVAQRAQGKWVLFTGNVITPTPQGFALPLRYTPRDPNDKLGLTSTWLTVKLSSINGYDPSQYRAGEPMAILAKYNGNELASPGYDLILLDQWFEDAP
jgi:hypothetical protein